MRVHVSVCVHECVRVHVNAKKNTLEEGGLEGGGTESEASRNWRTEKHIQKKRKRRKAEHFLSPSSRSV